MKKIIPTALISVIAISQIAYMATTKAVLAAEGERNELRYQIQNEAIEGLTRRLEEQEQINRELSWTISELQEQIEGVKFKPRDLDLDVKYQEYTYYSAIHSGVDPDVVFEIMRRESGYVIDAIGYNRNGTIDIGLMQINSCNWEWLLDGGMNVHDPYGNIDAGIYLLAMFSDKYPIEQAIACYAVGESGMLQGGGYNYAKSILNAI